MVRVDTPVEAVMNSEDLTLARAPFKNGVVIKRASYSKGEYPEHLKSEAINRGECTGKGKEVYQGVKIPSVAACVGRKKSK